MKRPIFALLAWCWIACASAASFDCGKAASPVERLVCATPVLSRLDDQVNAAYLDAIRAADDAGMESLRKSQRTWMRQRRDTCGDAACLTQAYFARLDVLARTVAGAAGADRGPEPQDLLGEYSSALNICFPGAQGDWKECEDATDTLLLSRAAAAEADRPKLQVRADFVSTNGHTCSFEGTGYWNGVDRVLASDAQTGCRLVLVHAPGTIHTVVVTEDQCRSHCGMRGSLDGLVLSK